MIFKSFQLIKSIFNLCDLDMQQAIWTIIKEGHIRIIPAKFGQNPTSSLGGDVILRQLLADNDDGRIPITKAHLVTMWQAS